jgi:hypothetical protein
VNNRGSFFSEMRLRNLMLFKELRMWSNLSITSSIVGRFSGLSSVIASTSSCINSKPLHFCNVLSVSRIGEGSLALPSGTARGRDCQSNRYRWEMDCTVLRACVPEQFYRHHVEIRPQHFAKSTYETNQSRSNNSGVVGRFGCIAWPFP